MGRFPHVRRVAIVPLLAVLLAPVVPAAASTPGLSLGPCDSLPGPKPDRPPALPLQDRIELNYTTDQLTSDPAVVELCVLLDQLGIPRELRVTRGGTPFDSAAVDAVRWWLFEPARHHGAALPSWTRVRLDVQPPEADLVVPDVLALASDAEARGDLAGAIDAWSGALARVGTHPSLNNEWTIREHILRLNAPVPRAVPAAVGGPARGARNLMQRNIARGSNEDYARTLDKVLIAAPWYVDAYRWRAAARAASGQRNGAMRDVLCYRLGVTDSTKRALADRALVMLAAGDTLGANSLLKN